MRPLVAEWLLQLVLPWLGHFLLGLPRRAKQALALAFDAGLCIAALWAAFYLRLGEGVALDGAFVRPALLAIALALPVFALCGLYRAIFRHSGPAMLRLIVTAATIYAVPFALICTMVRIEDVPRTIGLIQPLLLLGAVAGSRALLASLFGWLQHGAAGAAPAVLIYGAGRAGRQLAGAIAASGSLRLKAYLDDNPALWGASLGGVPIHPPHRLGQLVSRHGIAEVLLAIPSATAPRRQAIVGAVQALGLKLRVLPGVLEQGGDGPALSDLRPIALEDLLARSPVAPDPQLLATKVAGRVVLVTGAGGSIGSELCRQILRQRPARLVLLERNEFSLYTIAEELQEIATRLGLDPAALVPLLGSVTDAGRVRDVLAAWQPDTILHAAAYKHVPLVEHNIVPGVANNVIGSLVLAEAAMAAGVADFILISTDKAVRPTNVMGASKRLAELVLQGLQHDQRLGAAQADPRAGQTRFSMVRFGNVLGSSGSVVPRFRRQVSEGGPVTVTHPEVTRFFMTIPEAAQLVLQAAAMAEGGDVMVLDMGEPIRVIDLAHAVIRLSGHTVRDEATPDGDIPVVISGLRPGEKLYEEVLIGADPQPTGHPRIMRAHEGFIPMGRLRPLLQELSAALDAGDAAGVRRLLARIVEDYRPAAQIVDHLETAARGNAAPGARHAPVARLVTVAAARA